MNDVRGRLGFEQAMTPETCPNCAADFTGDPIPEKYRVHHDDHDEQVARYGRCYCLRYGERTHFSRVVGISDPLKDRVTMWLCPACGHRWAR